MNISAMASACSATASYVQIHGHHRFLECSRDVHALSSIQPMQKHQNQLVFMFGCSASIVVKVRHSSIHRFRLFASSSNDIQDNSTESREENSAPPGKARQVTGTEGPIVSSPSPFVGAKISSRITARTAETSSTTAASAAMPANSPTSGGSGDFTSDKPSLSASEKLKYARPSVVPDSSANSQVLATKKLLDALKQADREGKTTKFGQPVVPTNLFDEPKRSPADDKKFEFTLNAGQLILVFSFLTVISVMFGTAFVVWKVGGIHYNEY